MLQVAAELVRRHRVTRFYEIAELRLSGGGRVLQTMSGGDGERENLVCPQTLTCRKGDLQNRHDHEKREQ
jgi:hypothetical protein